MPDNQQAILDALRNVPRLSDLSVGDYQATRLGGLTNLVYRIELAGEKLIVRIPGAGTNEYIDRAVELYNAQVAAKAGISAPIIWADPVSGVMISQCIDPAETMTPDNFKTRTGAAGRAGKAMQQLHNCGQEFQFRFELFAMIDDYLSVLAEKNAELPNGYTDTVAASEPLKQALLASPAKLAPCHCDPLCENFLDDGQRMWIIDWEYSGMNDPLWDLGDLSVEAGFDTAQDMEMLRAYFGGEPNAAQIGRMTIYKAMCDLLWTLWGLIQHANGNTAEDFWAYAVGRFQRCKALMSAPEMPRHVAAVRRG